MKKGGFLLTTALVLTARTPGQLPEAPSFGGRIDFPNHKFSVASPPSGWEPAKIGDAVGGWRNIKTESRLFINANPSKGQMLSYPGMAEIYFTALKVTLRDKYPGATTSVDQQEEVTIEGKVFYRLLANFNFSPTEGVQLKGKVATYWFSTPDFSYSLSLTSVLGHYESDRPALEQMVRSFTYTR